MSLAPGGALTEWARLLLGTFAGAGVRDVVVSPGSRSTPFAWAALGQAALRCRLAWDERTAGFFALGQARVTGRPTLLLCTSGTAAAHYFPAVIEAAESRTPLLILSADRPFELQDSGALQTTDQVKLFGGFVRHFLELGLPDSLPAALDALERRAAQAVALALAPVPGPVHVNARARKPLEPVEPATPEHTALARDVDRRLARGAPRSFTSMDFPELAGVAALRDLCRSHARGLLVCGPQAPSNIEDLECLLELSRATGYPLAAEAASQLRFGLRTAPEPPLVGGLDALLRAAPAGALEPDLVITLGAFPTSSAFEAWAAKSSARRAAIAAHGLPDPAGRADVIVQAPPSAVARGLTTELRREPDPDPERIRFRERWRAADALYSRLCDELLQGSPERLSEPAAVRAALDALPDGAWLGLGNSLPIREVEAYVPPAPRGLRVWSQRGVSGIDGLVSGAAGAASVAEVPSLVLLGDISFLHDLGGLALCRELATPLALVVLDNGGGRIFEQLPLAARFDARPELERFWLTPHGLDFAHAAALYGLAYDKPASAAALSDAVRRALGRPGATLVHAVVEPKSALAATRALGERLAAALPAILAAT